MPSFKEMNSASFELCLCVTVAFRILQATPEQISMDLKNELMYQLEQDRDLQAVSLKYLNKWGLRASKQ